jgi:AcrR family transcriptional regulator
MNQSSFLFDACTASQFINPMNQIKQKTRVPRQKRGMETRDRLIVAALELFSEKGYHTTNSKEIASRGGVAIGSFYAYFKDKKELFSEAFKFYCALIEAELCADEDCSDDVNDGWKHVQKEVSSCADIKDKIRIILFNLMKAHDIYPGFQREIAVMRLLDPDIKKIIDEQEKRDIRNMNDLVSSMRVYIRVQDSDAAAYILYRTVDAVIHEAQPIENLTDSRTRILNEITDMIYRYLFNHEHEASE